MIPKKRTSRRATPPPGPSASPESAIGIFVRAISFHRQGNLDAAERHYRRGLDLAPNHAEACNNLGAILQATGRSDEAEKFFRRALASRPDLADAWTNLGGILLQRGSLDEAAAALRAALRCDPRQALAHRNLGETLRRLGRPGQAAVHLEEAIRLQPAMAEAHNILGVVLQSMGQLDGAENHFREAIRLQPGQGDAYNNLGLLEQSRGRLDEAIASIREAIQRKPHDPLVHSNLIFAMNYHPGIDRAQIFAEQKRWAEVHGSPLSARAEPHDNDPSPERVLRIGYVSPDFRSHPVAYFIEPILRGYDRSRFQVICYFNHQRSDHVTERLKKLACGWRDIYGCSDEAVAQQVRADKIDILVDLAGHSGENRLLLFARRPAPVLATYLGNPDSTGLPAVQYRISDAWCDSVGMTEHIHSEELVRLPGNFFCYRPPEEAPTVGPPPLLERGGITFGSFNNFAKISQETLELWGEILRRTPDSRLLLQSKPFGDRETCRQLRDSFHRLGIAGDRIETVGHTPLAEHLALMSRVDIALDTFPWNGHTTTCHTLWMGVPVIAVTGSSCISRMGVSILSALGLEELLADSPSDYVDRATALAKDPDRLQHLRSDMRRRMQASALMDENRFNRALEEVFRDLWRRWCAGS